MRIQCLIFCLITFATVAYCENENKTDGVPDRRLLNRRFSRLEDTENRIDNHHRHHHHHFTHNADWHKRHRIPMPNNTNVHRSNNDSELVNAEINNRFNSEELVNRSNDSGKRCEK